MGCVRLHVQMPGTRVTVPLGLASHRDMKLGNAAKLKHEKADGDDVAGPSSFRGGVPLEERAEMDLPFVRYVQRNVLLPRNAPAYAQDAPGCVRRRRKSY